MDDVIVRTRLDRPVLDESVALKMVPRTADTTSLRALWEAFCLPALQ